MLPWLDPDCPVFPDVSNALNEPDGLLAVGGNLLPGTLIDAYRQGIFPWYNDDEPYLWWSPDPRTVLHPRNVHISKSLKKFIRKTAFNLSFDRAFSEVIRECAKPRESGSDTWITRDMISAYEVLHELGHAHSVEVWENDTLVGGLYGLAIGQVFFGESMFSRRDNSSKYAFVVLCRHLSLWQFSLLDCQVRNSHLATLGASTIPRAEFVRQLDTYCSQTPTGANWKVERQWNDLTQ